MRDGLRLSRKPQRSLDERFANRPHTYERLHQIADMIKQAIADGASADEAEALAVEQIRRLGGAFLGDWAEAGHDQAVEQARLKRAGCWWKEMNAQAMLNLRVARANNLWNQHRTARN